MQKKGLEFIPDLFMVVGRVRLERTTNWLKANCSTD
jgi:hypothetical protein